MCQRVRKSLRVDIHLINRAVSTNDRYLLSARSLNRLGRAHSPFPRKHDVLVSQLARVSIHTDQPHPIGSRTQKIELIRGWVGDEAARAAVSQVHAPAQKVA